MNRRKTALAILNGGRTHPADSFNLTVGHALI